MFITEQEAQEAKARARIARSLALATDPVWIARQELSRQFVNVHTGRPDTYNKAAWDYINAKVKEALTERDENAGTRNCVVGR